MKFNFLNTTNNCTGIEQIAEILHKTYMNVDRFNIVITPKDQLMDADTKKEKFNFKTMGIGLFNLQINTKNGGSTS